MSTISHEDIFELSPFGKHVSSEDLLGPPFSVDSKKLNDTSVLSEKRKVTFSEDIIQIETYAPAFIHGREINYDSEQYTVTYDRRCIGSSKTYKEEYKQELISKNLTEKLSNYDEWNRKRKHREVIRSDKINTKKYILLNLGGTKLFLDTLEYLPYWWGDANWND
jgi:hypothetical protein